MNKRMNINPKFFGGKLWKGFKTMFFVTILLVLNACNVDTIFPSGKIVSETRNVNYFEKISVSAGIKLVVYNGEQDVFVEAHENLHKYMEIYVKDNCLYVHPQNKISFGGNSQITVYVTAEHIKSVSAAGGAKVEIPALLSSDELSLKCSGGSKLECENRGEIRCNQLFVDISGGSKMELEGSADAVNMKISGGGRMDAFYLDIIALEVLMSGGATAEMNVSETISGSLSGGSRISYKGNPSVSVETSGGSKVKKD